MHFSKKLLVYLNKNKRLIIYSLFKISIGITFWVMLLIIVGNYQKWTLPNTIMILKWQLYINSISIFSMILSLLFPIKIINITKRIMRLFTYILSLLLIVLTSVIAIVSLAVSV